jgi:hypothetical protein
MKNLKTFTEFVNESKLNESVNDILMSVGKLERQLGPQFRLKAEWNSVDGGDYSLEKAENDAIEKHGNFAVFTIDTIPKDIAKEVTQLRVPMNYIRENVFILIFEDDTFIFRYETQPIPGMSLTSSEKSKVESGVYITQPLKELTVDCFKHCLSLSIADHPGLN